MRAEWDGWISIDTTKAAVADAALAAGADIVNDVSGLRADPGNGRRLRGQRLRRGGDAHAGRTADDAKRAPLCGCGGRGAGVLRRAAQALVSAGIHPEALCFDPGIGFGKTLDHNLALLRALDRLSPPGGPLLLGVSRKSFIGKLLATDDPALRDWPTAAITSLARDQGVMLHRVHAVRPNLEALRMTEAMLGIRMEPESNQSDGSLGGQL